MNAKTLWTQLGNVPIFDGDSDEFEDESIAEPFLHFLVGTPREDIWHWFEETFNVSVVMLMYGKSAQEMTR